MTENIKYIDTSIGLIPSDWEVKKLKELGDFISGNGFPTDEQGGNTGIPFYKVSDMNLLRNENEMTVSNNYVSVEQIKKLKIKPITRDAIIFAKVGAAIYLERKRIAKNFLIDNNMMAFVPFKYSLFLKYSFDFLKLSKYAQTGALPAYNASDLRDIKIRMPNDFEQQKIAEILSTWDNAIDHCKNFIENLKLRNKGLTQKLLTGKIRVNGFEETKWSLVPIKKIAKDSSKKNPADKDLLVLSCTKHNGLVPSLEYFGRKIYSDDLTTYKIVSRGQFAYATNHIEEGSIGYQSRYDEALISPMYTVFQTDETVNDNFLFRVLKSTNYIHEYQKRMEGSIDRRGGLRWDEFSKIKVPIPEIKEQMAIVEILDKATEELHHYQQKLENLQLQKKGLMQQLLTGKVRVKV